MIAYQLEVDTKVDKNLILDFFHEGLQLETVIYWKI